MNVKQIYQERISTNRSIVMTLKSQLLLLSMLRLAIVLLVGFLVYLKFQNLKWVFAIAGLGIVIFLLTLNRYSKIKIKKQYFEALVSINQNEIGAIEGDLSPFSSGESFLNGTHEFSQDVDLFGQNAFFHHLNRTSLNESEAKLASWLLSNDCEQIESKQSATKELSDDVNWRQEFSASLKLVEVENSTKTIVNWMKAYQAYIPKWAIFLSKIYPFISAMVFLAYAFDYVTNQQLLIYFFIGAGISSQFLKKNNQTAVLASKLKTHLSQFSDLLALIENKSFDSERLTALKNRITSEKQQASVLLKQFSKYMDALDQRNNILFGVLGNGFLLWDIKYIHLIEKWIQNNSSEVETWFDVLESFDAYHSLANFAFNHSEFTYPVLSQKHIIKAESLGHFMIPSNKRVNNDVEINPEEFFIITGANMAGKSTFLRTIALQIISANVGLPVCARSFLYQPIKLITSMRTSDSLLDEESYFFSELKRLKFIVNQIKVNDYFIILDEILKGTNSKDKEAGSKAFVEKLVSTGSSGIIATHDLGLCEIAGQLKEVSNYYFDAEIINDELHFDYTFKKGICQNMNASFLLKKMEII